MLSGGVLSHQASAPKLFSEARTLSERGLSRVGRTGRVCHVRFEFKYRGGLRRHFSKSCGLESGTASSCRTFVRAGVEISKKKSAFQKHTHGKSKSIEFETETPRKSNHMTFVDKRNRQFGKDFSVLAELLSQQDCSSVSSLGGQKLSSPKHDPGRMSNRSVGSVRTMDDVLNYWSSDGENKIGAYSASNETSPERYLSQKDASQLQNRQIGGRKILVERGTSKNVPEEQSVDSPLAKGGSKESNFGKTVGSAKATTKGERETMTSQPTPSMWIQSSAETILASRQFPAEASPIVEEDEKVYKVEKPSLRGLDVLLAMQKAAMERAERKQRNRKASERAVEVKENALSQGKRDWRDARPFVIRPEWALQIESLEGRIKNLKNQMQTF